MKLDSALKIQQQRQQRNQRVPKGKPPPPKRIEPTPEQQEKGDYKSAGMAYKRTPVIDTMLAREQITTAEYIALSYYRDQAIAADKSPIKSNIDFAVRSGKKQPIGYASPQQIETARIERDLGVLQPIARAVAVDDVTLSVWAIHASGGREKLVGKAIVVVPKSDKAVKMALQDLRMAAHRITT